MIEHRKFKEMVTVRFSKRDDGGVRAVCEAVPGFYLSGADRAAVFRDVAPALEALLKCNMDILVKVVPLKYGVYQMNECDDADTIPEERSYVLERMAA